MRYLLWGILVAGGLYALDRLALWAETRGWIYYRRRHGGSGTLGNAFLEVQAILEPSKRHIVEERVMKGPATQESGDQPSPERGPTGGLD